jgi:hypothetical protein
VADESNNSMSLTWTFWYGSLNDTIDESNYCIDIDILVCFSRWNGRESKSCMSMTSQFMFMTWTFWYELLDGKAAVSNYFMSLTWTFWYESLNGKAAESNYFMTLTWTFWYRPLDGKAAKSNYVYVFDLDILV